MPNKELAVSDDALAKMDEMANEEMIRGLPSFKIPIIALNGKQGVFKRFEHGNDKKIDLGKNLEVILLRHRVRYTEYGDPQKKETWQRTTQEQDNKHKLFKLTHYDGSEKKVLREGVNGHDLQAEFLKLKMEQIEYCTLISKTNEPEIVKMSVRGSSLAQLFDYFKQFTGKGTDRSFLYVTKLSVEEVKKDSFEYFITKFKKGKAMNTVKEIDAIQKVQQNIYDNLKKIDDYYGNGGQVGEPHQIDEQPPLPTEAPPIEESNVEEIFPEAPKENVGKKIKNKKLQATIEKAKNYKLKK